MNTNKVMEVPDEHPDKFLEMPEGLDGYWWETTSQICIPFVANLNEGNGNFGKWLISLEKKGKLIFFPTIISARLEAMLRKHGYRDAVVNDENFGYVDGLAKDCRIHSESGLEKGAAEEENK